MVFKELIIFEGRQDYENMSRQFLSLGIVRNWQGFGDGVSDEGVQINMFGERVREIFNLDWREQGQLGIFFFFFEIYRMCGYLL